MSLLAVEPAWRLADRTEEHRWLVTPCNPSRRSASSPARPNANNSPSTSSSRPESRACLASPCHAPGTFHLRRRGNVLEYDAATSDHIELLSLTAQDPQIFERVAVDNQEVGERARLQHAQAVGALKEVGVGNRRRA